MNEACIRKLSRSSGVSKRRGTSEWGYHACMKDSAGFITANLPADFVGDQFALLQPLFQHLYDVADDPSQGQGDGKILLDQAVSSLANVLVCLDVYALGLTLIEVLMPLTLFFFFILWWVNESPFLTARGWCIRRWDSMRLGTNKVFERLRVALPTCRQLLVPLQVVAPARCSGSHRVIFRPMSKLTCSTDKHLGKTLRQTGGRRSVCVIARHRAMLPFTCVYKYETFRCVVVVSRRQQCVQVWWPTPCHRTLSRCR